jgi:prevent-host-death family protein
MYNLSYIAKVRIIGAMTTLAATELRNRGSEAISRVAYSGDRVLLQRHGKNVAAIVSIEDLELLQALEDRIDLGAVRTALKQRGRVAWDKVKADLQLRPKSARRSTGRRPSSR